MISGDRHLLSYKLIITGLKVTGTISSSSLLIINPVQPFIIHFFFGTRNFTNFTNFTYFHSFFTIYPLLFSAIPSLSFSLVSILLIFLGIFHIFLDGISLFLFRTVQRYKRLSFKINGGTLFLYQHLFHPNNPYCIG